MSCDKPDLTDNSLFWMYFDNNNMDQKVFFGTEMNFDKQDLTDNGLLWMSFDVQASVVCTSTVVGLEERMVN